MPDPILRLVIPNLPPKVLSPNANPHWTVRRRERQKIKDDVKALVLEQGWNRSPLQKARVIITFGIPDNRVLDDDNLMANGMVKAILDALTGKLRALDAKGRANGPWLAYRFVLQEDDRNHTRVSFNDPFKSPRKPQTIIEVFDGDDRG